MMRRPAASSPSSHAIGARGLADRVEHVEHRSRGAAVQRALERADAADDGGDQIGSGRCDHARGERRCVHAVVDHGDEVRLERARREDVGGAGRHPQVIGGVAERRLGRDRRRA
jgi:hypothetical protein